MKPRSFNLLDRCSSQRLGDVRKPSMALRTFHTTRLPSCRSFGIQRRLHEQLFSFTDFSVEESLCAVCHKSFVSLTMSVETSWQEHTDALNCCCCCKATLVTLRFFATSRCVLGPPNRWCFTVSTQRPDMTCVPPGNSSTYTSS